MSTIRVNHKFTRMDTNYVVAFGNKGGSIGVVEEFASGDFCYRSIREWGLVPSLIRLLFTPCRGAGGGIHESKLMTRKRRRKKCAYNSLRYRDMEPNGPSGKLKSRLGRNVCWLVAIVATISVLTGRMQFLSVRRHPDPNIRLAGPPSPCSFNSKMDEELRNAWEELDEGSIAYEPKRCMRQGQTEEVKVRITQHGNVDLSAKLPNVFWIEQLKVSGTMAAYLEGQPDEFEIRSLSSTQQALVGSYSEWIWLVTPIKSGLRSLNLLVVAKIRLSNREVETKDVLVKATTIEVEVDRTWATRRFFQDNWEWFLGSPIVLGLMAWVVAKLRRIRRKRRRMGF